MPFDSTVPDIGLPVEEARSLASIIKGLVLAQGGGVILSAKDLEESDLYNLEVEVEKGRLVLNTVLK